MKTKNVDSIVDELYSCLPNDRNKFDRIMNNLRNEIIGDYSYYDNFPSTKILSSNEYFQNKNQIPQNNYQNYQMNSNNSNSDFNNLNHSLSQHQNSNFMNNNNNNTYPNMTNQNYISTLPEGEFLNMKPFQPKSNQKIISDVHANTKFYYPEEYNSISNDFNRQKDMEWNNRANNIIYNTMRNNWNEDDLKLSDNINQMRSIEYRNNNNIMMNNNLMMNNNNNLSSNRNENLFRNDTFGNNQNMMKNNMSSLNNINMSSNINGMNNNNFSNNPMLNANRNYLIQKQKKLDFNF